MKINWEFGNSSILAQYTGSPVINKELVYISAGDLHHPTLYSINAQTGKEQWHYTFHEDNDSFTSPTIFNDNIYVLSVGGKLFSINALTGDLNWKVEIESQILSFPISSSPLILENVIYVGVSSYLCLFDTNTGNNLGKIKISDRGTVNTPVYANDGKTICVEISNGSVCAINTHTQEIKWVHHNHKFTLNFDEYPVVYKGIVYSGGGRDNFVALDLETGNKIWEFCPEQSQALKSPAVRNDLVCFCDNSGTVWGVKYDDGQILWSYKIATTFKTLVLDGYFHQSLATSKLFSEEENI